MVCETGIFGMWAKGMRGVLISCRGPLLFCLLLATLLSFNTPAAQRASAFSGVFATIWLGEAIVTLQIKLLGGNM